MGEAIRGPSLSGRAAGQRPGEKALEKGSPKGREERDSRGWSFGDIVSGQVPTKQRARTEQPQADLPPEVIEEQRDIQAQREPLLRAQEHDAEEAVDGVLRQHQLKREQRRRAELDRGTVASASMAAASSVLGTQNLSLQQRHHCPEL